MPTRSALNMGWSSVIIAGGGLVTPITLTEITALNPERSASPKTFYGDVSVFAKMIVNREKKRTLTITTGNVGDAAKIPEDAPLTVTAVWNDALNGSGVGAITVTLANAIVVSNSAKGPVNEFGLATVEFMAYSSDGTTDPMTVAQA